MGYPADISADDGFTAVPADATILQGCTGIYVGVTGDVQVRTLRGQNTLLFKAVPAGVTIRIKIDKIFATNTTATQIVGLN